MNKKEERSTGGSVVRISVRLSDKKCKGSSLLTFPIAGKYTFSQRSHVNHGCSLWHNVSGYTNATSWWRCATNVSISRPLQCRRGRERGDEDASSPSALSSGVIRGDIPTLVHLNIENCTLRYTLRPRFMCVHRTVRKMKATKSGVVRSQKRVLWFKVPLWRPTRSRAAQAERICMWQPI